MCDIQIVTGLGILISGFADLWNGISAYHFQLVSQVAWFSSLTHICGLTILRRYFHSRPIEKWVRLGCMILLALMLLIAILPTLFFNWIRADDDTEGTASQPGTDAICLYNIPRAVQWYSASSSSGPYQGPQSLGTTAAYQNGIVSIVLLIMSLVSRTIKLNASFSSTMMICRRYCSDRYVRYICRLGNNVTNTNGVRRIAIRRTLLYINATNLVICRLYCDSLVSNLSDVSFQPKNVDRQIAFLLSLVRSVGYSFPQYGEQSSFFWHDPQQMLPTMTGPLAKFFQSCFFLVRWSHALRLR